MIFLLFIIGIFSCNFSHASGPSTECIKWFERGKVKPGKGCEIDCAILPVDMGTFICPNQCEDLCKDAPNLLSKFIFYPGLTPAEEKLTGKYPKDASVAFVQKVRAELSSRRNFPNQDLNDESDAFRHFVWAGLLIEKIGAERAREFLEAHEADPDQPNREKQMDIYNNEKGIQASQALSADNKWSIENLESKALEALRSKELTVMKPGLEIPKEPK